MLYLIKYSSLIFFFVLIQSKLTTKYNYISFSSAILKKKDIHSLLRTISILSQMNNRGIIYKCDTRTLVDDRTYRVELLPTGMRLSDQYFTG